MAEEDSAEIEAASEEDGVDHQEGMNKWARKRTKNKHQNSDAVVVADQCAEVEAEGAEEDRRHTNSTLPVCTPKGISNFVRSILFN